MTNRRSGSRKWIGLFLALTAMAAVAAHPPWNEKALGVDPAFLPAIPVPGVDYGQQSICTFSSPSPIERLLKYFRDCPDSPHNIAPRQP